VLLGAFRNRDGRLFFVAIGLWAIVRAIVSTTWRDPVVAAGLTAAGLISVGIAVGCAVMFLIVTVRGPATDAPPAGSDDTQTDGLAWPDPETRPRF
jgi:CHASE2 domain-containing sensor protein